MLRVALEAGGRSGSWCPAQAAVCGWDPRGQRREPALPPAGQGEDIPVATHW